MHITFQQRESGQSTIELAILLPVLLLLVTGMSSFGLTIRNYAILTDAVNVASRQLAISRGQTTDPCATAYSAVTQAAPTLTAGSLGLTTDIYYSLAHWQYPGNSCSSPNTYSGAAGNLYFSGTVRLTVTYPCAIWRFGMSPASCTLTATTSQTVQ